MSLSYLCRNCVNWKKLDNSKPYKESIIDRVCDELNSFPDGENSNAKMSYREQARSIISSMLKLVPKEDQYNALVFLLNRGPQKFINLINEFIKK